MSIPGVPMEGDEPQDPVQDPAPAEGVEAEHDDDDGLIETVTVGNQKMVPVGEMIRYRKESKATKREVAELKARAERAEAVGQQLNDVMPLIEKLRDMTPAQREALATGRMPSLPGERHDAEDVEAKELAEDLGLIAADGSLDIARARKRLDKDNERYQRMLQEAVAPVRQHTAQQQARILSTQAKAIKDDQGVPMASAASIDEAYAMLPPELASQPNVAMVAIGTAMLIDKMKGRRPAGPAAEPNERGYQAPIYSESPGGRRGVPALTAEERASASKLGLTEKDLQSATAALSGAAGRRGIAME